MKIGVMRRDGKFVRYPHLRVYMNLSEVAITASNPILVLESLKNAKISSALNLSSIE